MQRIVILFSTLFSASSCGLYDNCVCANQDCTAIDCSGNDDEAGTFTEECGKVMFVDGMAILSHNACTPEVSRILSEFGEVPFSYAVEDCGPIPESEQWDCFAELDLLSASNPVRCGYCPNYSETTDEPYVCWRAPSEWVVAILGGHVTNTFCDDIEPPIGSDVGYTLPMDCLDGMSCLGGDNRCSCKCRNEDGEDIGHVYASDFISRWWEPYLLPDVPPLVEGIGYPVEATCTGEPLVWKYENGFQSGQWVGTTIELDGFDPVYPPNGELWHTPAWELVSGLVETHRGFDVSAEFAATATTYPHELQYGAHVRLVGYKHRPALLVDACEPGSICAHVGLEVGDTLVGSSYESSVFRVDVVNLRGASRSIAFTVTQ
jgi:hypothetical protein